MKSILISLNSSGDGGIAISEVAYLKNDIDTINRLIGSSCFTSAGYLPNGDVAYVDDNGLLTLDGDTLMTLTKWYPDPLAGNILISGLDKTTGDSLDVKSTTEEVLDLLEWSLPFSLARLSGRI